jgi:hypothetical protein
MRGYPLTELLSVVPKIVRLQIVPSLAFHGVPKKDCGPEPVANDVYILAYCIKIVNSLG